MIHTLSLYRCNHPNRHYRRQSTIVRYGSPTLLTRVCRLSRLPYRAARCSLKAVFRQRDALWRVDNTDRRVPFAFAVPFRTTSKAIGPVMNVELKGVHAANRARKAAEVSK